MNIYQKLLEVKKSVPYLKKDAQAYNFKYADPESVLGALNPLLNNMGIILKTEVTKTTITRVEVKSKSGTKMENLYNIDMLMTWVNVDDPTDKDVNQWSGSGINGEEQGFGSALTYGERYFMLKYFNIPTGKDDPDSFVDRQMARQEAETKPKREPEPDYIGKIRILINEYQGADKNELANLCAEAKKKNEFTLGFAKTIAAKLGGTL